MKQKKKTKSFGKFVGFLFICFVVVGGFVAINSFIDSSDSNSNSNPPVINNNDAPTAIYVTDESIVF